MIRKILSVQTEKPVYGNRDRFGVGDISEDGYVIENISRSIGGLADVTSIGPGGLGPNCPSILLTMVHEKEAKQVAIPERLICSISFEDIKKKEFDPEINMSKEG